VADEKRCCLVECSECGRLFVVEYGEPVPEHRGCSYTGEGWRVSFTFGELSRSGGVWTRIPVANESEVA